MSLLPARLNNGLESLSFSTLCIAAITFPFSVAISNIALGCAVGAGILSGALIPGMRYFWKNHRLLSLACWAYPILLLLGLIWSLDRGWGIHIATKYWYWFLIPIATAILTPIKRRELFLASLSLGLTLHLFFCIAQMLGLTDFTLNGASASNATGHIGRIGFGFVYGTWACWLLHWGSLQLDWKRWAAWALAAWSIIMVFLAEGRSGYIIVTVLLLVILWKLLQARSWKKVSITVMAGAILIAAFSMGPGKERVLETWQSFQNIQQGHFENAEARWSLWYTGLKTWQNHKLIGVGTGGYPVSAESIKLKQPELTFGPPGTSSKPAHPHNIYLLALSRWGPTGLVIMLFLLVTWAKTGWKRNWQHSDAGSLITLPALAMIIHGLSSSSLEEHFSGIIAIFLLTAGFASLRFQQKA